MSKIIQMAGHLAAVLGLAICLISGLARLSGSFFAVGFEAATLFVGGIALMVAACLARLYKDAF